MPGAGCSFAQWQSMKRSECVNCSVGLHHLQQCVNVCFVHICTRTNQRDELNIQSQTSTLYFCYITSFPSLSLLPVYVLKNYIWNICIKNVVDARLLMLHMYDSLLHCWHFVVLYISCRISSCGSCVAVFVCAKHCTDIAIPAVCSSLE